MLQFRLREPLDGKEESRTLAEILHRLFIAAFFAHGDDRPFTCLLTVEDGECIDIFPLDGSFHAKTLKKRRTFGKSLRGIRPHCGAAADRLRSAAAAKDRQKQRKKKSCFDTAADLCVYDF